MAKAVFQLSDLFDRNSHRPCAFLRVQVLGPRTKTKWATPSDIVQNLPSNRFYIKRKPHLNWLRYSVVVKRHSDTWTQTKTQRPHPLTHRHTHTHTHTHAHTHKQTHTYTHRYIHTYKQTNRHTHTNKLTKRYILTQAQKKSIRYVSWNFGKGFWWSR